MNMKVAVLWDFAPCILVDTDRRFRGACCLLPMRMITLKRWPMLTGLHGADTSKTGNVTLMNFRLPQKAANF